MTGLLAAALIAGCGYRFSAGVGRLPDGGRRLSVEVSENLTAEPSASSWFTDCLRREADHAGLELGDRSGAARLQPRVVSIQAFPRGVSVFGGRFRTREQEVLVRVELFCDLASGQRVHISLNDRESYLSAPDLRGTEANRQLAVQRTLARLARTGIERLSRSFE